MGCYLLCLVNELIYIKHLANNGKFRMVATTIVVVFRLTKLLNTVLIILKFYCITMQLLNNCVLDMLACHW